MKFNALKTRNKRMANVLSKFCFLLMKYRRVMAGNKKINFVAKLLYN